VIITRCNTNWLVFKHIRNIAISVCLHRTTWLPLGGFSWNLIVDDFSKICQENTSFIKFKQGWQVLFMKTDIYFRSYLPHSFLEWKLFQTKFVEKLKTHILCSTTAFRKSCRLWDNIEKCCSAWHATMTTWRMLIACWIPKATNTHLEYVILIAFQCQWWLHKRASMLQYTYVVCLVITEMESVYFAVQTERLTITQLCSSL